MVATSTSRSAVEPIRPTPRRALPWPVQFYRSAVGRKWVMGLTGLMLVGFVVFQQDVVEVLRQRCFFRLRRRRLRAGADRPG